jgi:hypothetical protein
LQAQAREAQADLGELQQSKFFAKQPPRKYTATTGNSPLIKMAILDKISKEQRESLLLAELSHVSVLPYNSANSGYRRLRQYQAEHYHR